MRLSEIIEKIRHDFGLNITTGHIRGSDTRGQYNRRDHGIRSRIANDLPTIAHELGHHFDEMFGLQDGITEDMRQELLDKLAAKGVKEAYITLHVGLGTFRPVKAEEITEHHMHSEFCMISQETADIINETKRAGGRIVCVGTTSCRTLESLADENGYFHESSAWTDIFIYPGYKFKAMDALITNFHQPESTLVMLVSAFADREKILNAYNIAVQQRYRFFSFGDAMFIS